MPVDDKRVAAELGRADAMVLFAEKRVVSAEDDRYWIVAEAEILEPSGFVLAQKRLLVVAEQGDQADHAAAVFYARSRVAPGPLLDIDEEPFIFMPLIEFCGGVVYIAVSLVEYGKSLFAGVPSLFAHTLQLLELQEHRFGKSGIFLPKGRCFDAPVASLKKLAPNLALKVLEGKRKLRL